MTRTPLTFIFGYMDKVAEELSGIKKVLEKMLDAMPKPENKITKFLKAVVLVAGALGIFHTAEIVRRWIAGG